jgi:DNA-directed RNA polymerase specialized sigma24 family protein
MLLEGSVTHWIEQLKEGDQTAARELWNRYFRRLVGLARVKLQGAPRGAADEEDMALSAFDSFCQGAAHGRFPKLDDRDDLWHLLVIITERKTYDWVQHERRQKRGGGEVLGESALPSPSDSSATEAGMGQVAAREPTPEIAAQLADECRRLLECLGDATLRYVAVSKMEGYTNAEIADKLACAEVTIERKLQRIRGLWTREKAS